MTPEDLLSRFGKLQIWAANGQRAPHKPLLLLWAVGRCLRGEERLVSYQEADRELAKLLGRFGPHRRTIHTEDPFWRLQHDGVWEVQDAHRVTVGAGGNAHKNSLLKENTHAGFPAVIQDMLRANDELASCLASNLVDAHFPPTMRDYVLQSVGITSRYESLTRRRRDPSFSPAVLTAYGYQCAVCEFAVCLNGDPVGLEAAHIRWHEARGPDEVRNGLALCALHHRLFDKGVFTLSPNRQVIVANSAAGKGVASTLGQFHSKPIVLPASVEDWPGADFLRWHSREVFDRYSNAVEST